MAKDEGNPAAIVRNYLVEAGRDQVRGMLQAMAQVLMSADADPVRAVWRAEAESRHKYHNGTARTAA